MFTVLTNDPFPILTLNTKFDFVLINPAIKYANLVMPDLIRHPVPAWIPAFAGMTFFGMFNCRSNNLMPECKTLDSCQAPD